MAGPRMRWTGHCFSTKRQGLVSRECSACASTRQETSGFFSRFPCGASPSAIEMVYAPPRGPRKAGTQVRRVDRERRPHLGFGWGPREQAGRAGRSVSVSGLLAAHTPRGGATHTCSAPHLVQGRCMRTAWRCTVATGDPPTASRTRRCRRAVGAGVERRMRTAETAAS